VVCRLSPSVRAAEDWVGLSGTNKKRQQQLLLLLLLVLLLLLLLQQKDIDDTMVVSSVLVNVSDDAEVRLVTLLADAAPRSFVSATFSQDCQKCIQDGHAGALLDTVLKDAGAMAALIRLEPTEEAMGAVSLLSALSERAGRPVQPLAEAIVNAPAVPDENNNSTSTSNNSNSKTNKEARQVALLSVLYNMRSQPSEKCWLLCKMIELAGSTSDSCRTLLDPEATLGKLLVDEMVGKTSSSSTTTTTTAAAAAASTAAPFVSSSPGQPPLVALLDSWKVTNERRAVYRTVASVLPETDPRKQRFLLLLVDSYSKDGSALDATALEAAKEAAIGAIRNPLSLFVHQRHLLSLPVIQAWGKDPKNKTLFELLKVFQEGKLVEYQAFLQANGGEKVLTQWGLDPEACTRHMRILSLCTLASEHEEIPYSVIAETLQLAVPASENDTQVESWVIAAVSSGLLEAKMDQLARTVMVERSVVRRFDMEQWKALQSRLSTWKQNVANVLAGFKESQASLRQS